MDINRSKGFTLIELLVVIAIIGILSAVVLASLNTARQKGNDASIQSNLDSIRTQAEIYYGGTGANSYGTAVASNNGTCPATANTVWSDATVQKAVVGAANGRTGAVTCNSTGSAYAISALLYAPIGANTHWCVDSAGNAKAIAAALASADTSCD
jgi:prepilin-type N-terminal cleavage/methylation domain-containing protein